jgi:hypothetical protein
MWLWSVFAQAAPLPGLSNQAGTASLLLSVAAALTIVGSARRSGW